jgi:hypothetical protein
LLLGSVQGFAESERGRLRFSGVPAWVGSAVEPEASFKQGAFSPRA